MSIITHESEARASILRYRSEVEKAMRVASKQWPTSELFAPVRYLINIGGKRLRPALALASCEAEGGDTSMAIPAALAVEVFHNFTLMHDDIMDQAPLRRGSETVHEKWDANTAILSGDAMFVQAYEELSVVNPTFLPPLLKLFNRTAIEVCEGQQRDMAFELRSDVSIAEYMEMIRLKTSVLLAASLQMGALVAGADSERQARYYQFGLEIGLAFQLQDDLLDAFGNPETFGKQVGGDILSDKKTFLHIRCFENASAEQRSQFEVLIAERDHPTVKVEKIKALFEETGARADLVAEIDVHYQRALQTLESLKLSEPGKSVLTYLAEMAVDRVA
jgi:geranylgeranyl diphosphate synthase type II